MQDRRRDIEIYNDKGSHKDRGREGFYSGVMILSISAVVVKIIGLVFKIPMLRLLGSEGMGYFNSAYEIYALLCVISTSGLPVAMSVIISRAREQGDAERVFKDSMRLLLILGGAGSGIMLALSYPLAIFLGNEKSFYAILAIAPALLFICITSAYRGYFQGLGSMSPTALSQVIEALCKLIVGLLFASVALNCGARGEVAAACAVLGLPIGGALSSLCLWIIKRSKGAYTAPKLLMQSGTVTRELIKMALPITLSAAVVSITKMIDMTMILRRLQDLGCSGEEAFSIYGSYTTLCLPLFSLAPALVGSVAMPILPRLGRAIAERDRQSQTKTVNDGIAMTAMISMPISAGLALYSKEILELIFKGESEAIELCAPLLTLLAFSVSFSAMVTLTNAVLQAYGHPTLPLLAMGLGALIKFALAYVLIGDPRINILGAPVSTFFCDLVINIVSLSLILRFIPGKLEIERIFVRPFVAAVLSVGASKIVYGYIVARHTEGALITLVCIALAAVSYCVACLMLKIIDIKDIIDYRQNSAPISEK